MLGLSTATRRTTARGLLALMGGIWLLAAAAPCVMATPHCPGMNVPCEGTDHAALPAAPDCDTLQAVDCRSSDINLTDRVTLLDFTMLPAHLLTVAPVSVQLPRNALHPDVARFALRLSPPPLYLQHSVFLI